MPTVEMMYDKRPTPTIYAICINENREETLRVLQLLFNYGYVFDARRRLKAIPKFLEEYGLKTKTKFCDWFSSLQGQTNHRWKFYRKNCLDRLASTCYLG